MYLDQSIDTLNRELHRVQAELVKYQKTVIDIYTDGSLTKSHIRSQTSFDNTADAVDIDQGAAFFIPDLDLAVTAGFIIPGPAAKFFSRIQSHSITFSRNNYLIKQDSCITKIVINK